MNYTILYPASFFSLKEVDPAYEEEYTESVKFPEYQIVFYNYDEFISGEKLRFYPKQVEESVGIYRGWMLQQERYEELYQGLLSAGIKLINLPQEYVNCHEFPNSYPLLKEFTPRIKVLNLGESVPWDLVKKSFSRFMMKDYVKSVKGTDFPAYFDQSYSDQKLDQYMTLFIQQRDKLFVKGIVLKEYVDLKKLSGTTNEYRVFYLFGKILSVAPNSNQKQCTMLPQDLPSSLPKLPSNFYTVDFAEQEDGSWIVIETGDGQVSGLSPGQYSFKFYETMLLYLKQEYS